MQRKKLRKIDVERDKLFYGDNELVFEEDKDLHKIKKKERPYIQLHESLTSMNSELLKEARNVLGDPESNDRWEFPGYVGTGGQIRAKKSANNRHHIIRCKSDIAKLVQKRPDPTGN